MSRSTTPARAGADRGALRPIHLAVAAVVAAACVLIGVTHLIYETDLWEHLVVGKMFWAEHRVSATQIWTWPNYGAPNVNPSWGFSALLWPFWSLGEVMGLQLWRWLTALATFALLWLAARKLGAKGLAPLLVLVICALVYRQRMQIRPETLSGVLFALSIWILERRRHGGTPTGAWLLVPVALIWANTHISCYLLFVLLGFHLLDAQMGQAAPAERRSLGLVALACVAAALLNPFGWRALFKPVEFILWWRHEPFFRAISEIRPIVWSQNLSNGLPLLLAGWPLLLIRRARIGRVDRVEWLMAIAFTAQALSSGRFVATYVLAAAPYVARGLEEWLAAIAPRRQPSAWARTLLVSAACVAACLYDWRYNVAPLGLALDASRSPVRACDWMRDHDVRGRGMNHFQLGGYLLWRFWPERDRLPFMDIHGEDSPREVRDGYVAAMTSRAGWRALDDRYRFDYAVLSRRYADRPGLLDVLDEDEGWSLVFVDDVAALYLRRQGPMAPLAGRFAYRTLGGSRATIGARLEVAARDTAFRAAMAGELARQAAESPLNFYGRSMARALAGLATPAK